MKSYKTWKIALCLLVMCAVAFGGIMVTEEDDVFAPNNKDCNYTQGLRFDVTSSTNSYWYFGQLMYTPTDITNPNPQPGDHPWVGLLFGGYGQVWSFADSFLKVEGLMGVTGEPSLAGQTQAKFHHIIGSRQPMGWTNQLGPDFVVNANFYFAHKVAGAYTGNFGAEAWLSSHAGVGLLYNAIGVGPEVRLGYNLPPTTPSPIFPTAHLPSKYRLYATLGTESRYVPWNYFISGSLIDRPDTYVEAIDFVTDAYWGVNASAVVFDTEISAGYKYIYRTKEYESQTDPTHFGSIYVSVGHHF